MKKTLIALLAFAVATLAKATVDIEIIAGQLTDASGNFVADGSYVDLISLGTSGVLSAPTSTSFVSGTEQLLSGFSLQSSSAGSTPGAFDQFVAGLTLGGANFASGQQLAIEWFPTLSAASNPTGPGAGTSYGAYTNSSWLIPSNGGDVQYLLQTILAGGSVPNIDGQATLNVAGGGGPVPEPAAFALLGGLSVLGLAAVRRRVRA